MKTAVIRGPFKMEIEERSIPVITEREVLVRIKSVGICGSDVHGFLGISGKRRMPGLVMGHEASGEVEEVGSHVEGWKNGDRVTINPQQVCGYCNPCRRGWPHLCDNMSVIGSSMRNFKDGAMCEYIAISPNQLFKITDTMSFNEGSMLDPVGNALHVINRAPMEIGNIVAIIGTGVIGLLLTQVARIRGAGKVIAVDSNTQRLRLASDFGADRLINSRMENIVDAIMSETNGRGADIVIEAVGLAVTYQNAVNSVRKRGAVMALGFRNDEIPIPIQPLLFKEISLIGNTGFVFEIQSFIDFVSEGKINVKPIITHEFALEDVQKAFELLADETSSAIKVILKS